MRLSGQSASPLHGRALVTGGTSGIGLAFANALAERGCALVLVARSRERLEERAHDFEIRGVPCEILQADLQDPAGIRAVCERLASEELPIEVLVNNAGFGLHHKLATTDTEPLTNAIDVMASATVCVGGAAGAAMAQRGHGVIINTASVSALVPMGLYSGIKALVRQWSRSLAVELRPKGVQVMTFMPGWVRTELHERSGITTSNLPGFVWLSAERVANDCLRDVDRGKTYSVPSKRFKVIAALAEHAPRPAVEAVTAYINRGRD